MRMGGDPLTLSQIICPSPSEAVTSTLAEQDASELLMSAEILVNDVMSSADLLLPSYLRILTILINKGKGANGAQVLKPDTVDQMFEDQLAKLPLKDPRAIYKSIAAEKPEYTNVTPELFPGTDKGWGLSALLTTNEWPTGRSPGSLTWAGLVNVSVTPGLADTLVLTLRSHLAVLDGRQGERHLRVCHDPACTLIG